MNPTPQKRIGMKTLQIVALFLVYLVIFIPIVQAQPVYVSPNPTPDSGAPPAPGAASSNESQLPTSPFGPGDAEAPAPSEFSDERGAYVLLLNLDVPSPTNKRALTLRGTTNPHARVLAYLNPSLPITDATAYNTLTLADNQGSFVLNLALNDGTQHLMVVAEGREEVTGEDGVARVQKITKEYDVTVDTVIPEVTLDQKLAISEGVLTLKGTASENVVATTTIASAVHEDTVQKGAFEIRVPVPPEVAQRLGEKIDVRFLFTDEAGNTKFETKNLLILGGAPRLFSHNLYELSPTYAQKVTVRGNATPGAAVFVTVNGEVTPNSAWSSSLLDLVKSLPVRAAPNKEYATVAKADGSFEIDVLVTQQLEKNFTQYLPQQPMREDVRTFGREYDIGQTFENKLQIFVMDQLGRSASSEQVGVVFAKCSSAGFWEVQTSKVTPSTIIPEHLRRGLGQLGFNVNLKWRGPSERATILSPPRFRVLRQSVDARKQYAFDPNLLVRNPIQAAWSDDYTVGGVVVNFNQLPYIQKNLSDIRAKKDLLLKIPVQMEILFEYDQSSIAGVPRTSSGRATGTGSLPGTSYVSGRGYESPYPTTTGPIPGVVTEDPGRITKSQLHCIDVVTTLDLELDERWLPEWLLKDSIEFFDNAIETLNEILQYLRYILIGTFVTCLGSFVAYYYKLVVEKVNCLGKYSTDPDSQEKQQCLKAIEDRQTYERYMKWVCDRVYCPAAPTLGLHLTEAKYAQDKAFKTSSDTKEKYNLGSSDVDIKASACGKPDVTENAVYEAADELLSSSSSLLTPFKEIPVVGAESDAKKCGREYLNQWNSVCWSTNELQQSKCLYETVNLKPGDPAPTSCGGPVTRAVEAASTLCQEEVRPLEGSLRFGGTLPVHKVRVQIEEEREVNGRREKTFDTKEIPIRDRWFKYLGNGQWEVGTFYDDVREVKVTDARTGRSEYRYQSQGDKQFVSEYPRTILSREEAEKYGLVPRVNRDYVVDPTSGIMNSLRCMCLPAINTYVALLQRVFTQFRQCFQSILLTGEGSSGMCRRAFSETLCDFIIEAVRCFAQRYGAGYGGARAGRPEGIGNFFAAIASAGDHMHTTISDRYGRTNLYQMLNERSLVHSACFYAFTGDFDIDIEGALTGIGSVPVASEGFLYPKQTRRYITSNPVSGNARFIYNIAGGLVAGSELTYGVELVCTASPTNCKQIYGFAGNRCDCAESGEKRYPLTNLMGSGVLAAGEYVDMDEYLPVELPYRFDRVRMYWQWRDNTGVLQTNEKTMEIRGVGDPPPATCEFKLSGYRCDIVAGQYGRAAFLKRPTPVKSVFLVNEPIEVQVEVEKYSPTNLAGTTRPDLLQSQTLSPALQQRQAVPFFLAYQLRDQNGNIVPLERYAGSLTTLPGASAARSMSVRALVEDGVARFTIPSITLTKDMITRGVFGGSAGYARSIAYTNPDFGEAVPNKIPLRGLPAMDAAYPTRENLAFGVLVFKTKDGAGREKFCYGVQRASLSPDHSTLLEGSRNYQFETVPGAIPCTDGEVSPGSSSLAPLTTQKLKNNVYLFDTALGTISYHGVQLRPEYGGLQPGQLYADGYIFLAQQQTVARSCSDITSANPVHWKLNLELRPCKTREEKDIPSIDTCIPGDAVVRFGGRMQEFVGADAIDIPVACDSVMATGELPTCRPNELTRMECQCTGTGGSSRCGIAEGLNYCTDSGQCTGYEACSTTDRNGDVPVDPSNRQNLCDCNGKLGGNTDMECGLRNYCVPCPIEYPNQYACVPQLNVDDGTGKPVGYFTKNPSDAARLCKIERATTAPPVPTGPLAPGTGEVNPSSPSGTPGVGRVPIPLGPQPVTLGIYGPATIDPSTVCALDDSCRFYPRADNVPRPKRVGAVNSIVLHITAGGSAYDTYRGTFFGATDKGTHYIVERDGTLMQLENEDIITYHAGCAAGPNCPRPGINQEAVGIDLANYAGDHACANCVDVTKQQGILHGKEWTYNGTRYWELIPEPQMKALVQLVTELMLRHGIGIDNIYFHSTKGRPAYTDGTSGYSCEGFAADKPAGIYAGHEDPGPLFNWCAFKAAVQQALREYQEAEPLTVAAAPGAIPGPDENGANLASGFVDRVSRLCSAGINEACLRTNKQFVVHQFNQYYDLCQGNVDCTQTYTARIDETLGSDLAMVIIQLDDEVRAEAEEPVTGPTAVDGARFARHYLTILRDEVCAGTITRVCLDANKALVAQKLRTFMNYCQDSVPCKNAFSQTLNGDLDPSIAQRIDEIYGEVRT